MIRLRTDLSSIVNNIAAKLKHMDTHTRSATIFPAPKKDFIWFAQDRLLLEKI